jgi:hypothetical protein
MLGGYGGVTPPIFAENMLFKSIGSTLTVISLWTVGTCHLATAADATITFSGFVAPACTVTTIDSQTVLPIDANPAEYLLSICNTGQERRLIYRGSQDRDRSIQSVTIVP